MQLARAAPTGAHPAAATAAGRRQRARRRRSVAVQASDDCRNKINSPVVRTGTVEGTSTLVFVGAGGQEQAVECPKDSYVLDAGIDAGLELPFTCRGGICGACVVRVTEGELDQSDIADLSFTLSEEEVARGMALICMSRPLTDTVRLETQSDWGYSLGTTEWKGATGEISGRKVEPLMGAKWDEMKQGSDSR